jgi:F-type H+-transporting ATPase subunit b
MPIASTIMPIADSSSGSFLITPDLGLMAWVLIMFFLSLFILNRYVFPRIRAVLDRRQATIDESIDAAEHSRQEADEVLSEYRERLRDARQQAEDIVTRAQKAGQAHEREVKEAAEGERQRLLEQAKRDIEAETRRAISEIRGEVANLTVAATERVTRKTLSEDDQRRLIEDALSDLDFSALAGEREGA